MLTDLPITSQKEEEKYGLDRYKFSHSLADAILNYENKESFIVGISGEWGSGKSSIVNMALEHINNKDWNDEEKPIIIKFNPWNFSDQNQLIFQFFNELSTNLENYSGTKKAVQKLKSYAIKSVIVGGIIANPQAMKGLMDYIKLEKLDKRDLENIRENIDDSLREQGHKIIISIEDIDRLNNLEIRQIFQLVKLLANFPNTIYILEFDKNVVAKALEEDIHENYSSQYIEKIVQVIYDVPKISELEIELILNTEISELIGDYIDKLNKEIWTSYYQESLVHLFKDIRNVKRYINTLQLSFGLLKDEVDLADLFAITAIQIFLPEVYETIKNNKELFACRLEGIASRKHDIDQNREEYKELIDKIINENSDKIPKNKLKNLLKGLFPIVGTIYNESTYGPTHDDLISICVPESFDTYFRLSVHESKISREEFFDLLSNTDCSEIFGEKLIKFREKGKTTALLDYLGRFTRNPTLNLPQSDIEQVIAAIFDKGDLLCLNNFNLSGPDDITYIYRIVENLIIITNDSVRFDILKNAIENSEESVFTSVFTIDSIEKRSFINKTEIKELKRITCKKIEEFANNGKLIDHYDPFGILYYWNEWCDRNKIEKYLDDLIIKNDDFIVFIQKTIKANYSKESINEVIGLTKLKKGIIGLKKSSEFEELDDKNKEQINNFLKIINSLLNKF